MTSVLTLLGLGLLWIGAPSASAAPALFTGFVDGTSTTIDFCMPGSLFQGGNSGYSCTQSASGTASVMLVSGGFTVPAGLFTLSSTLVVAGPSYPYLKIQHGFAQPGKGSFKTSYLPPSLVTTVPVNTSGFPTIASSTRAAFVKLSVGSRGLGGNMSLSLKKHYSGATWGNFGNYDFDRAVTERRGRAAPWNTNAGRGTATLQTLTSVMVATLVASSRFAFFTGTVRAYQPQGISVTTFTGTGIDSRITTPSGFSGVVSLVSPSLRYMYIAFPDEFGSVQNLRSARASIDKLNMTFLPEPHRLALLMGGLLGLMALSRRRPT